MSNHLPSSVKNIHPHSHPLSSLQDRKHDLIILGSGPAGRALAIRASKKGNLSVLLVENELVGGECHFWACVPSKAMLRPAEAINSALNVGGAKELIAKDKLVDLPGMWARRDKYADQWEDSPMVRVLEGARVMIVRGHGRIAGTKQVALESTSFKSEDPVIVEAKHAVVIAGGSDAIIPSIPGLRESNPWTSRDATSSRVAPPHLIILGAGAVGTEMATAYASFGSKVTLITSAAEVLPRLEPEAGKRVRQSLVSSGVKVLLSTQTTSVQRTSEGVKLSLSTGDSILGSELLVATGRKPRTSDVGLDSIGLEASNGFLSVDDAMRVKSVSGGWLFAIGDVNGRALTTHVAKYQGRVAADNIIASINGEDHSLEAEPWSSFRATADRTAIPQVVFTDPNVACVGLTLAEAQKAGFSVKEVAVPFKNSGAALHEDGYSGWAQWVVDTQSQRLVGATFVGRDAADLLHASTVAVVGAVPLQRLWHAIPSFPSLSEVYLDLMEACGL